MQPTRTPLGVSTAAAVTTVGALLWLAGLPRFTLQTIVDPGYDTVHVELASRTLSGIDVLGLGLIASGMAIWGGALRSRVVLAASTVMVIAIASTFAPLWINEAGTDLLQGTEIMLAAPFMALAIAWTACAVRLHERSLGVAAAAIAVYALATIQGPLHDAYVLQDLAPAMFGGAIGFFALRRLSVLPYGENGPAPDLSKL
jgi:hypothetical protein